MIFPILQSYLNNIFFVYLPVSHIQDMVIVVGVPTITAARILSHLVHTKPNKWNPYSCSKILLKFFLTL